MRRLERRSYGAPQRPGPILYAYAPAWRDPEGVGGQRRLVANPRDGMGNPTLVFPRRDESVEIVKLIHEPYIWDAKSRLSYAGAAVFPRGPLESPGEKVPFLGDLADRRTSAFPLICFAFLAKVAHPKKVFFLRRSSASSSSRLRTKSATPPSGSCSFRH